MRVATYENKRERTQEIIITVDDADLNNSCRSHEIISEVKFQIAKAIADKVLAKLGPIIDEALQSITEKEKS
jgi:hypothetical protein